MGSEGFSHFFRFFSFFFVFFRFSSFFFAFLRFSSLFFVFLIFFWDKGRRLQFTGKMGNFTPTPSAPTPFGTSRKILVSVKFVSAILGPEMAAPILWTPGKMRSFCRKTCVHKIPRFRGGGYFGFGGWGGSADFIFMGARIFLILVSTFSA